MVDVEMNVKTIQKYFKLSDYASSDMRAFQEIVSLFSETSHIQTATSDEFTGKTEISNFFKVFFGRNEQLKHIMSVRDVANNYQTEWVVAGLKSNGSLFSLHGFDYYQFDNAGKISSLKVEVTQ